MIPVAVLNQALSVLTVVAQILTVVIIILLLTSKQNWSNGLLKKVTPFALSGALFVAFLAMAGSLYYSDVIGYEPCKLCWYQRIFMYPLVPMLMLAIIRKREKAVVDFALLLSLLGAVIAGYHYLLQLGVAPGIPCTAVGYSVACSQRFVLQLGYITIPMMALAAFGLIIALLIVARKR